jgi:hypothetical protein
VSDSQALVSGVRLFLLSLVTLAGGATAGTADRRPVSFSLAALCHSPGVAVPESAGRTAHYRCVDVPGMYTA